MSRITYSPSARQDLRDILAYIRQERPLMARQVTDRIRRKCRMLGDHPGYGELRPDLGRGELRVATAEGHIILYRQAKAGVEIVRVLHGARDWEKLV